MIQKREFLAFWATCLVVLVTLGGVSRASGEPLIKVSTQGRMVFGGVISPIEFAPVLKFDFGMNRDARLAKVHVQLEVSEGPSGKDVLGFALPVTRAKAIDVTSYQSDVALQITEGAMPGVYRGRVVFVVDPPTVRVRPESVPFAFTLAQANVKIEWVDGGGSRLRLGSISTGGASSYEGPSFVVKMGEGVDAESKVNVEMDDAQIWIKGADGRVAKGGIGALGAGRYQIVLDPEIPSGRYQGTIKFSMLSVGTKINDQAGAFEVPYELKVTNPLASLLKAVVAVVFLAGVVGLLLFFMKQRGDSKKASGKPVTVEGMFEFVVPMERRPEDLARVGKTKIVFGDKGDMLKDVRRINFSIAAYVRDGKKVVELTRAKDSCPIHVNGVDAFNVEIFDGDLVKFGEYPTFEVKYRNEEIVRPVSQVFGEEEAEPIAQVADAAPVAPIGIATADESDGELVGSSGGLLPVSETEPPSEEAESGLSLDIGAPDEPDDLPDLALDIDLDSGSDAGQETKGDDSIDLPEGFDLLGDDS